MITAAIKRLGTTVPEKIRRCVDAAEKVNAITGECKDLLLLDIIYNWYRYGCSDEDYFTLEFSEKTVVKKNAGLHLEKTIT